MASPNCFGGQCVCYFTSEPPTFEFRGGMFFITHQIGGEMVERAMSPHVFMRTVRRANEALKAYQSAEVVRLPAH